MSQCLAGAILMKSGWTKTFSPIVQGKGLISLNMFGYLT